MAITLAEILSTEKIAEIVAVLERMRSATGHWLENVDGDPARVRMACKREQVWTTKWTELLDPNREAIHPVTCPKCLAMMADEPTVVDGG